MTATARRWRTLAHRAAWPLRIAVLGAIVALAAWKIDLGELRRALNPESWTFIVAALSAHGLSVVFKAWTWKGVIDELPGITSRTRLRDVLSPIFVGFLFNSVLAARLGEIVRVALAKRRLTARGERVGTTVLFGSVVVENLVTTIAWVAVVLTLGAFLPLSRAVWITTLVIGIACLSIALVATFRRPRSGMPPWLSTGPLWRRAQRGFTRLWGAIHESHIALKEPRVLLRVALPALGMWAAQLLGIWCALRAFGLDEVGWAGAGLLLVTVTVAQIFPVLPGNVGVFQAAVVVPLTNAYPVSSASALAFALGLHATEIIIGVVVGFVFLMVEGVSFRQLRAEAESEASDSEPSAATPLPAD
jgi:uncharacterized membrane protein YbhN (UPF0104 family)